MFCGRGFAGEGADDVVGLEAGEFEDWDAIGLERAADVGDLLSEISAWRRDWPCSLCIRSR